MKYGTSPKAMEARHKIELEAMELYNRGHSTRSIGIILGYSHEWVRQVIQGRKFTLVKIKKDLPRLDK